MSDVGEDVNLVTDRLRSCCLISRESLESRDCTIDAAAVGDLNEEAVGDATDEENSGGSAEVEMEVDSASLGEDHGDRFHGRECGSAARHGCSTEDELDVSKVRSTTSVLPASEAPCRPPRCARISVRPIITGPACSHVSQMLLAVARALCCDLFAVVFAREVQSPMVTCATAIWLIRTLLTLRSAGANRRNSWNGRRPSSVKSCRTEFPTRTTVRLRIRGGRFGVAAVACVRVSLLLTCMYMLMEQLMSFRLLTMPSISTQISVERAANDASFVERCFEVALVHGNHTIAGVSRFWTAVTHHVDRTLKGLFSILVQTWC
jgi:hypothetical protein